MTDHTKSHATLEKRRAYYAFLDFWIPIFHEAGIPGRRARTQADRLWGKSGEKESGR